MSVQSLIELLTPSQCLGCGKEGEPLCTACQEGLSTGAAVCWRCSRVSAEGRTCYDCQGLTKLAGVSVAAYYEGAAQQLILQFKFHHVRSVAAVAAGLVLAALPLGLKVDVVTGVPVSAARHRERGYNQSDLIAKRVAKALGVPFRRYLGRSGSVHQLGSLWLNVQMCLMQPGQSGCGER
jgi:competence protein ComFC